METSAAIEAFAALAQAYRLAVFRLLMRHSPTGLTAGAIAAQLSIAPSTLSHHLAHLERAGLLRSQKVERQIFYAVDIEGTRRLVTFLTQDCCQGLPEICGFAKGGSCRVDHDLSQPGVRDVTQCPRDDSQRG